MLIVFDNREPASEYNDEAYLKFINEHPSYFVAHTGREYPTNTFTVHIASCPHINNNFYPGWHTEGTFIKIVSDDLAELREWREINRLYVRFKECWQCKPMKNKAS